MINLDTYKDLLYSQIEQQESHCSKAVQSLKTLSFHNRLPIIGTPRFSQWDVEVIPGDPRVISIAADVLTDCLNEEGNLSAEAEEFLKQRSRVNVKLLKEDVIPSIQGIKELVITRENIKDLINIADYFVWDKLFDYITNNLDQFLDLLSTASKNKNDLHQDLLKVFMSIKSLEGKVVFIEKLKERKIDIKKFILPQYLKPFYFRGYCHTVFHEAFLDRLLGHRGTFQNYRKNLSEFDWEDFVELIRLPPMYQNFVTDCLKKLSSLNKNDLETFKTNLISRFPNSEVEAEQTNKLKAQLEFAMESLKTSEAIRRQINWYSTRVDNLDVLIALLKSKMTEIDTECSRVEKKHVVAVKIFQKIALAKLETLERDLPIRQYRCAVVKKLFYIFIAILVLSAFGVLAGYTSYHVNLPTNADDSVIYNLRRVLIETAICSSILAIAGPPGLALFIFDRIYYPRLKNKHLIQDIDFQKIRDQGETKEVSNGNP